MMDAQVETESGEVGAAEFPRPFWYAAIASQKLNDRPAVARVLDWDLALFRDADGAPHAVHDRCAHRGAQLSLGEVRENRLACRYHGWRYAGDGRCVHIPSLTDGQDIAKGLGVRGFPCAEADGYVWVWMGEGAPSPSRPQGVADYGRFNWTQGSVALNCSALAAIENNLDWCHPVFAHAYTHGQFFANQAMGFREQSIEMRRTDRGLTVFNPPTAEAADPIPSDAWTLLAFELPDRVTVSFPAGPRGPMRIVLHMVPTGPGRCRQEWMISTGEGTPGSDRRLDWSDETPVILEQDRIVLESVQRTLDNEGYAFERSVEADAPTLLARRIYALASRDAWASECQRLPERRIVKLRS